MLWVQSQLEGTGNPSNADEEKIRAGLERIKKLDAILAKKTKVLLQYLTSVIEIKGLRFLKAYFLYLVIFVTDFLLIEASKRTQQ